MLSFRPDLGPQWAYIVPLDHRGLDHPSKLRCTLLSLVYIILGPPTSAPPIAASLILAANNKEKNREKSQYEGVPFFWAPRL